ncbi:MAG TPA: metal-dependent hydrolase [Candidatus Sulfopaludibacter sp.]|nr:metal-dependent hydrolase [Terracidiphilus sp.]HEV2444673.1 metal-dependent hydrolase [Candidatus Sulfopaludibacter sp.]
MEPITHFLTGACIGRAGLNRKTAYATLAAVLAAEAADLDVLWGFGGPVEELKHHRGITHTFLFAPVVAGVVVGMVWLLHRFLARRRARIAAVVPPREPGAPEPGAPEPRKPQPVHWGWLYAVALLAALSHILLDWTNNYGVRPFFPFNPRWYAGSFVFIVDPILLAILGSAIIFPALLGLADREIGVRRPPFRGRGWAIFALCSTVLYWGLRWTEHAQAINQLRNNPVATQPVDRIAMEPYPWNPFHWHALMETASYYQNADVNTWTDVISSDPDEDILLKPRDTPAVEAAKQTPLGRVYLDWGSWAVVRDLGHEPVAALPPPDLPPGRTWTAVGFEDLRFAYRFSGSGRSRRPPLSGWVYIIDNREDGGEGMGNTVQK